MEDSESRSRMLRLKRCRLLEALWFVSCGCCGKAEETFFKGDQVKSKVKSNYISNDTEGWICSTRIACKIQ